MIVEYLSKGSDQPVSLHFPEGTYYYAFLKLDHSLVSAKEKCVFGNSDDFRNFHVQHSVRFEVDCIHTSYYQIFCFPFLKTAIFARWQDSHHIGVIIIGCEYQHAHFREMNAHPARDLNTAGFRHLNIQHRDIGFVLLDERLGFFAISRFGDDLNFFRAFKQLANPCADDVMVVSQKNADLGF